MTEIISQKILAGEFNHKPGSNVGGVDLSRAKDFFELVKFGRRGTNEYNLANNMQSAATFGSWDEVLRTVITFCANYDTELGENALNVGLGILKPLANLEEGLQTLKEKRYLNDESINRLKKRLDNFATTYTK